MSNTNSSWVNENPSEVLPRDIFEILSNTQIPSDLDIAQFEEFLYSSNESEDDISRTYATLNPVQHTEQTLEQIEQISLYGENNVTPMLSIFPQPRKTMRFRYVSELNHNSFIYGCDSVQSRKKDKQTYVKIIFNNDKQCGGDFFVRCLLTEEKDDGCIYISPHKLISPKSDEGHLFKMKKNDDFTYSFELKDFQIKKTKTTEKNRTELNNLYTLKKDQFLQLGSELLKMPERFNSSDKAIQVQIAFDVYQCVANAYVHVTGPIFSESIANGEIPKIKKLCNLWGMWDEQTDVTMLVSGIEQSGKEKKKKSFIIEMYYNGTLESCILDYTLHMDAAISFYMPPWKCNETVKCELQLVRTIDGARSNKEEFTYKERSLTINGNKRRKLLNVPRNEVMQGIVQPDAIGNTNQNYNQEQKIQSPEYLYNVKLINVLAKLYEYSTDVGLDKNSENFDNVRMKLESFVLYHPLLNSILHDILQSEEHKKHEDILYKIIEHYELWPMLATTRNIYGETSLMYACTYNRTKLIRVLIEENSPIDACHSQDGNNVLHIMQRKSHEKCLDIIKDVMVKDINAASFIRALRDYNISGRTPLHEAVIGDNESLLIEMLKLCQRHNALDACEGGQQSDGNTILHLAALYKSSSLYDCILKYTGTQLESLENNEGNTAADIRMNLLKEGVQNIDLADESA